MDYHPCSGRPLDLPLIARSFVGFVLVLTCSPVDSIGLVTIIISWRVLRLLNVQETTMPNGLINICCKAGAVHVARRFQSHDQVKVSLPPLIATLADQKSVELQHMDLVRAILQKSPDDLERMGPY